MEPRTLFTLFQPMELIAQFKNQFLLIDGGGQRNLMEQVCDMKWA